MPLLQSGVSMLAGRMPKVIKPGAHAVADYAFAATFLGAAALLWGRNRRAAIGCLFCGGTVVATSLMTDYPGGVWPVLSFRTHGRVDAGLAAATATLPRVLGFGDEKESKLFTAAALASTVITAGTDYDTYERSSHHWGRREEAEDVA